MIQVSEIDINDKKQVKEFIRFPYDLYKNHPQWVPPLIIDVQLQLNPNKHPFYERSDADFFIAKDNGKVVGRIAALENKPYNEYHNKKDANFYLFELINEQAVADALFERLFEWAKKRKLNNVVGPKGFSALDGYGILVKGFEHHQMMNMMNYNYPYYSTLVENLGFEKEVDFVSHYAHIPDFRLPERIHRIADRIQKRGTLKVKRFSSRKELKSWAMKIGRAYNNSFVNNWEYYPLTDNEIDFVLQTILYVADPRLIKIITHNDDVVGFLFGFADVSRAMQRAKGHLFPFGLFDILINLKNTKWIAVNGAGILPEFQGHGGNALLYSEMEKTVLSHDNFEHADFTQIAETAVQMRKDLTNIGGVPYKNHRVYHRNI